LQLVAAITTAAATLNRIINTKAMASTCVVPLCFVSSSF